MKQETNKTKRTDIFSIDPNDVINIRKHKITPLFQFRLKVKDISVLGRATQGVTLMRTSDGGKVVSIETLTPDMEEE